ncbi:hypothetical protein SO802_033387 [Lithocarpus litseifolius]|uniref:Uncharacterized protein n=1 Tax=Lithocarpus litseifolius TaxID=425828 RepID=A0AAW2BDF6_9ROSI
MEHIVAEEKCMNSNENKQPHQAAKAQPRKGGFRTMPFIIVNESFEKVASYGLMPNMILYLIGSYNMKTASASSILLLWSAISNVMAIFGAFLSDSYLGRFRVISLGSISSLLGMTILWSTAMMPQLKPPSCDQSSQPSKSLFTGFVQVLVVAFKNRKLSLPQTLAVAAITENIRRGIAIEEGLVDSPGAVIDISALWLVPQFALLGLAEAFNAIGQIEFYYSQLPKRMSSISVAIFTLGTAVANLVGSLLVNIVDGVTSKDGHESWLSSNLNEGHLDYYYWLISVLGLINFIYFVACCWVYGPAENPTTRYSENIQNDQFNYRELPSS